MSVRCISQVLDKSKHSGSELLMLVVLADYSDDQGNSYPGVAAIARKCRMKPRNANYVLKALQESGELRVFRNEGRRGTNRYRIMLERLGVSTAMQSIAPLQVLAPLQHTALTPATECTESLQPIAPEPSLNRQEPSRATSWTDGFDKFYQAYPRKVGKEDAMKAYAKVKAKAALERILVDIDRRQANGEWTTETLQFIPYPANYLNAKRWEDECAQVTSASVSGILPGAI